MNWSAQFIKEAKRLGYPVAWFADNLSPESLKKISEYSVFVHDSREQFSECSKMIPYKALKQLRFDWAIQVDIDETFAADFKEKLEKTISENPEAHAIRCPMVTVYEDSQRIDGVFGPQGNEGGRDRAYNLMYNWAWIDPITCCAKLQKGEPVIPLSEATTVHWGYATKELRQEHAKKWKEILQKVWGKNPYQKWEQFEKDSLVPILIPLETKYKII